MLCCLCAKELEARDQKQETTTEELSSFWRNMCLKGAILTSDPIALCAGPVFLTQLKVNEIYSPHSMS